MKNVLKISLAISLFTFMMLLMSNTQAQSVIGKWKTIDDDTGKAKSILEIYEQGGKYYGKVVEIFREPDEDPDPLCDKCDEDDPRYKQKVRGMIIMQDLEQDKNNKNLYEDGNILDPENGSVYSCYIELESADKLKVRGFLGFSLLGRTQYWYRQ